MLFWCRNQMYPPYFCFWQRLSVREQMDNGVTDQYRTENSGNLSCAWFIAYISPRRPCLFLTFGPALQETSVSSPSVFSFYGDRACQIELCSCWQSFRAGLCLLRSSALLFLPGLVSLTYFRYLLPHHTWQYLLESFKHLLLVQWHS